MTEKVAEPDVENDEYDSPWKEAIEHYFSAFMAFYFPEAYAEMDWSKEPIFLDQELQAVVRDAELGKRFVDKLIRVSLRNGDEKWIYIHIEVQGTKQAEFAKRMFVYNYRLFDRYDRPVASMAVLADEQAHWKPDSYGFEVLGCKHRLDFPIAKLTDYHDQLDELLELDNVFSVITATHILTQRTRKNDTERYQAKQLLIKLLYQRNWDKQKVIDLFYVIDWMMRLPAAMEQQLWHEIETIEESKKMRYVTSVEKIGIAKGRQEGWQEGLHQGLHQGLEQGLEQGLLQGESKLLRKLLEHRFGALPSWATDKLKCATEQDLEAWGEAVLTAPNLGVVFDNGVTH